MKKLGRIVCRVRGYHRLPKAFPGYRAICPLCAAEFDATLYIDG